MSIQQKHVRVDITLYEHMTDIKQKVGVPITETIRRALWWYLLNTGQITAEDLPETLILPQVEEDEDDTQEPTA